MESKPENLWGYAKRLDFVERRIEEAFPNRAAGSLRILDVGCGNGSELSLPLARRGFQVTGIDTHAPSIEHARQLAANLANVAYISGRVEELTDQQYDVVIVSEVLEHLEDPRALLLASTARLGEGGIVIVTVPNGFGEFEIDSWIFRTLRLQRLVNAVARSGTKAVAATDNHESDHIQFFTRRRLRRLFSECSLSVFREGAGSFLGGPMIGHTLARSHGFIEWNARITNRLPLVLASGWYFALRREPGR